VIRRCAVVRMTEPSCVELQKRPEGTRAIRCSRPCLRHGDCLLRVSSPWIPPGSTNGPVRFRPFLSSRVRIRPSRNRVSVPLFPVLPPGKVAERQKPYQKPTALFRCLLLTRPPRCSSLLSARSRGTHYLRSGNEKAPFSQTGELSTCAESSDLRIEIGCHRRSA
jgi:hypothetical protein